MVTEAIRTTGTPRRSRRGAEPWLLAGVLTVAVLAAAWWQSHPKAFDTLTAERGAKIGITNPIVGTINLYQVGEWAASHVARHYQQAKRALA